MKPVVQHDPKEASREQQEAELQRARVQSDRFFEEGMKKPRKPDRPRQIRAFVQLMSLL